VEVKDRAARESEKIGGPRTYERNMMPLLERHFHVTLIEPVVLEVSIVIARCEAHLLRLSTLDEGGGTNSSDIFVFEGDNALLGAACKVGRRALIMEMISGPAESAGPGVGAFATVVAWVLTVAREAIGKRG
jgi:hypothetical protein